MKINFLRSSSYSNYDFCQQQYFLNYVLGIPRSSGKKALMGTTVHKVLECLAKIKQEITANDKNPIHFTDREIGFSDTISNNDLYDKQILSDEQIDKINATRINKEVYVDDCKLNYGHTRQGVPLVEKIISATYSHYSSDDWFPIDYKHCTNWVWMVLDYNEGLFDPRNKKIVAAEQKFDIEIQRDWAKLPSGKFLKIKGTIDLISEVENGIIEIEDYKTGRRLDWTSKTDNDVKTYAKLCTDFQLMLYYYAAHYLYPKIKQIIVTIFYIRDGGPFTVCFDDDTLRLTEDRIQKRLEEIQNCTLPVLHDPTQQHFKCKYICDYYKIPSPNGKTNLCLFINEELKKKSMEEIVKLYTNKGFDIGYYEAPGEI